MSERLQIIDATHLQAKVDLFRLPESPPDTLRAQVPGSSDPDARFGRKSKKKNFYGLGTARYRSLVKVTIQVLMTCLVVNCKKMAKLVSNCLSKLPAKLA